MIIVKMLGGLGNQLFQYAFGRAFSIDNNIQVIFDISDYTYRNNNIRRDFELKKFPNINVKFVDSLFIQSAIRLNFIKKIKEEEYTSRFNKDNRLRLTLLSGYWQSLRFFEHIENIIKKDLELPVLSETPLYDRITETNSISVHIRLTDYLSIQNMDIYKQLDIKYYVTAIDLIKKTVANPFFFVFSDDIQKAKLFFNTIDEEVVYVNNDNSFLDFVLMKSCKHNIIANSTYSWWAAWLNNNSKKIVIAPQKWYNKESEDEIVPQIWTKI